MDNRIFVFCILFFFLFWRGAGNEAAAQTPGEWTWMHGDNTPNSSGVFGIQGVSNPANKPPALYEACEWTDNNGNFWLLGGAPNSNNAYAALWKYNPTTNEWTWMKGPSALDQSGIYGTQGLSSPGNYPGSRAYGAITFLDVAGNLWLFGGYGRDAFGGNGNLNDLWKYDISTNEWTWMKGSNVINDPGSYGTQGTSAPTNLPPSRSETSCSWTDNAGNFWLYGGMDNTIKTHGDLWKYTTSTNEWTWMHGANTVDPPPVYGVQGVANPANTPGGRWAYGSWTDLSGNLWLFGGANYPGGIRYNDFWKYDITLNQWTWMKGSNTVNDPGNHGAKCVSTNNNMPSARLENRARVRDTCGNFWNFGGSAVTGTGTYNDLWHYNVSANQWTWVSGDNIPNQAAVYGTQGASGIANKPGAKGGSVAWIDNNGYIWVFGGMSQGPLNYYNDLFRYVPDPACVPGCNVLSITVTSTNVLCGGQCVGSGTVNPSNGIAPYTYSWNTTPVQTTQTATGLCAGSYTVTVTDATSSTTATVTITEPLLLTANIPSTTNVNCNALCNGSATASSSGGTAPYTYTWNTAPMQPTAVATGLCAGSYTVTVTDANSCTTTQTISITEPTAITATITSNPAGCNSNGNATVIPSGGTTPYTYNWNNNQSAQTATGLSAGNHTIIITDANGCTQTQTVTITPVANTLSVNAFSTSTSCTSATGSATANPSGGTAPYTYSWSSGHTSQMSTGLGSGTYTLTVTDANGCTQTQTVTVTSSNGPNITLASQINVLCSGDKTGSALVNASGGTLPYTYLWNTTPTQNTSTASGLTSGNYIVTVADAAGCIATQTVMITEPASALSVNATATPTDCNASTGTATVNAAGGTGALTYLWNNSQITQMATGLVAGNYTVMVTDANGCSSLSGITVTEIICPCPAHLHLSIPNAFSPNNDGENDVFCLPAGQAGLQGGIEECIREIEIIIYNRWGEKVYESNDKNFCWDGFYKDKLQNPAVFVYYMEATLAGGEKINKTGNISLIR